MRSFKAYLAGIGVVCIWSGWITVSRYGVHTALEPADITLLRYCTALIGVSPLLLRHDWRRHPIWQYFVIGLGVGFPYTLCSVYGLKSIQAAHAGVLVNGLLPVFGAATAWILFGQKLSLPRVLAIGLIFAANLLMAAGNASTAFNLAGILYLLAAAAWYTAHMTGIHLWKFSWQEVIVTVPVVNVCLFAPLYPFLPTALLKASVHDIVLQAVYQGIIVNMIALMFVAYAIRHLGTIPVALFMSFVPVSTALLAWMALGETLSSIQILGIAGCSLGLLLYARGNAGR